MNVQKRRETMIAISQCTPTRRSITTLNGPLRVLARWPLVNMLLLCTVLPGVGQTTRTILLQREFHHRAWGADSGVGSVFNVQQGAEGYLWLTTSTGVFSFDGVRFVSIDERTNGAIRNSNINSMYVTRSHGLVFSTRGAGLLFWKQGQVTDYPDRRCTPALPRGGIAEGPDGSLWFHTSGGLFRLQGSQCTHIDAEFGFPKGFVLEMLMDSRGTLWVETSAGALLTLPNGKQKLTDSGYWPGPSVGKVFLHEAPDAAIWISDDYGLRRVIDKHGHPTKPMPSVGKVERIFSDFVFDREGYLWAGMQDGVRRFIGNEGGWVKSEEKSDQHWTVADGMSSDGVQRLFVDAEGNLWIGTTGGFDQLRHVPLTTIILPRAQEHQYGIAPADNGSVWLGSASMPLSRLDTNGLLTSYPQTVKPTTIRRDIFGNIWASGEGRSHLLEGRGDRFEHVSYPGEEQALVLSSGVDKSGGLWISRVGPEIFYQNNGSWTAENKTLGRKPNVLGATASDPEGNVWFAFSNNLVEWTGRDFRRFQLTGNNISPTTLYIRGDHVWLAGEAGAQLFTAGNFHTLKWKDATLPGKLSGVLETESGDLWLNGFSGVTHVTSAEMKRWLNDLDSALSAERLNAQDGLPGFSSERFPEPSVIEGDDGKIWFATAKGVAWLNPSSLAESFNRVPPPVDISSISADGRALPAAGKAVLPPNTQTVKIEYTAPSLAVPERVLFRYKLDGVDNDWQEAGNRREAFYTKLRPGNYVFRVIACNSSGVWNSGGASTSFRLEPLWYQTNWFVAICLAFLLVAPWVVYRLRIRFIARSISARFDERLAERTRIARELHDSFVQTIQGSKLVADDALDQPNDPVQMRRTIEQLSLWLGQAVQEGRAALNSLRNSATQTNDLAAALRRASEVGVVPGSMSVRFVVLGDAGEMHPIVRDEIYRIGYEAIRNTCLHSGASQLEIEIVYADDLTLRVRDNGIGIDPLVADKGKQGHFGLSGMRERAERIGGKLTLSSSAQAGTEITLIVPGDIIFRQTLDTQETLLARIMAFLRGKDHV